MALALVLVLLVLVRVRVRVGLVVVMLTMGLVVVRKRSDGRRGRRHPPDSIRRSTLQRGLRQRGQRTISMSEGSEERLRGHEEGRW